MNRDVVENICMTDEIQMTDLGLQWDKILGKAQKGDKLCLEIVKDVQEKVRIMPRPLTELE